MRLAAATSDVPSLNRITPLILTLDEELNIGRTLSRLEWAPRVVVVDSGSVDRTIDIVRGFPNTELIHRPFDSHRKQWNFALQRVETEWALTLDADYEVPFELVEEIADVPDSTENNGFWVPFHYRVLGKVLERTLYPPKQVLIRVDHATFEQDMDTERVVVDGPSGTLATPIVHDDRKTRDRWLKNQAAYARFAADKLTSTPWTRLSFPDRIRRTRILGPPAVLLHCLIGKGLILKGWAGWYYTLERVTAESILSLALIRSRCFKNTAA